MEAPKCRLCQKNHWAREGCNGMLTERMTRRAVIDRVGERSDSGAQKRSNPKTATGFRPPNSQREGRRVLKGSTGQPAKPTRTASTERTDPATPAKAPADRAIAEKAGVGIPKPRRRKSNKKKAKVSK